MHRRCNAKIAENAPITSGSFPTSHETQKSYPFHKVVIGKSRSGPGRGNAKTLVAEMVVSFVYHRGLDWLHRRRLHYAERGQCPASVVERSNACGARLINSGARLCEASVLANKKSRP